MIFRCRQSLRTHHCASLRGHAAGGASKATPLNMFKHAPLFQFLSFLKGVFLLCCYLSQWHHTNLRSRLCLCGDHSITEVHKNFLCCSHPFRCELHLKQFRCRKPPLKKYSLAALSAGRFPIDLLHPAYHFFSSFTVSNII